MISETGWLIEEQPYSFKEYQKIYGKNVNKAIRKDFRFICYEQWEKDSPKNKKGLSEEESIRRQIDFDFKEAYSYLIKTIDKTSFDLEVEVCSKIVKESIEGYRISRNYELFLRIRNKKLNNQIYLNDIEAIYRLCFQMTSKDFFQKIAIRFDKNSFYSFLYVQDSVYEDLL